MVEFWLDMPVETEEAVGWAGGDAGGEGGGEEGRPGCGPAVGLLGWGKGVGEAGRKGCDDGVGKGECDTHCWWCRVVWESLWKFGVLGRDTNTTVEMLYVRIYVVDKV